MVTCERAVSVVVQAVQCRTRACSWVFEIVQELYLEYGPSGSAPALCVSVSKRSLARSDCSGKFCAQTGLTNCVPEHRAPKRRGPDLNKQNPTITFVGT